MSNADHRDVPPLPRPEAATGPDGRPIPPRRGRRGARDLITCAALAEAPDGTMATVAGLIITRQRPGTASGVIFLTLEDETGVANVVVWPKTYERFRRAVIAGRLVRVRGRLQREGMVRHLIAWTIEDMSHLLDQLGIEGHLSSERGDEGRRPIPPEKRKKPRHTTMAKQRARHPREEAKTLFPSRDFH